jgi:hypothetical protein
MNRGMHAFGTRLAGDTRAQLGSLAAGLAFVAALAAGDPGSAGRTLDVVDPVGSGAAAVSAAVPDVPARVVGLADPEKVAKVVAAGPYAGFDTNVYPGDEAMKAWKAEGTYDWVGYYLAASCHKDASWSGKRERLEAMGWGTAVVYVGQQTWGRTPNPSAGVPAGTTCGANLVSAEQGKKEAADAIAKTAAEGFAPGTVIFLDIEYMDGVPQAMRDYYTAWTDAVLADGRYRVGYYAHTKNAARIYTDVSEVFARHGVRHAPQFWIAGGSNFHRTAEPRGVGHTFAAVWQGLLDTWERRNGVRLPIDVNVAAVPSPSSHEYATGD